MGDGQKTKSSPFGGIRAMIQSYKTINKALNPKDKKKKKKKDTQGIRGFMDKYILKKEANIKSRLK